MWAWAIQTADIGQPDFADFKIGRVKSKKNHVQLVRLLSQLLYYLSGVYMNMVWTDTRCILDKFKQNCNL